MAVTFGMIPHGFKFLIDDEKRTIVFYLPKSEMRKTLLYCIQKGVGLRRLSDVLAVELGKTIEIAGKVMGKNLLEYYPDIKDLSDEEYQNMKPTPNMDVILMKEFDLTKGEKKP